MLRIVLIGMVFFATNAIAVDSDLDGDGLSDIIEDRNGNGVIDAGETDANNADSDRGGEADGSETRAGRNPLEKSDDITFDRDGDGLTNGQEAARGTNPDAKDSDEDGVTDPDDPFPLEGRYSQDEDKDGLPKEVEHEHGLSDEVRSDALEDRDNDGLSNVEEFQRSTDIELSDTDGDGISDGAEVASGSDPKENPCLLYDETPATFADLGGHWAQDIVQHLHQTKSGPQRARIIDGYSIEEERRFLPDREITRYELLKMAIVSTCTPIRVQTGSALVPFSDVPSGTRPHEDPERRRRREIIETATVLGLIEGYADPEDPTGRTRLFRADAPITRAEALKILTHLHQLEIPAGSDQLFLFWDVPGDAWYADAVQLAAQNEIIDGYEDGTFRPGQPITRAEAAKMILLLLITNSRLNGYVIPYEF